MPRVCLVFILLLVLGCSERECREVPQPVNPISLEVTRVEADLFRAQTEEEIINVLKAHPNLARHFLHNQEYPDDRILARRILRLIKDPYIDTLRTEALMAFENFAPVREELETLYGSMKTYFPETKIPQVKTIVSGLYNDLYIGDETLVIGIDFFIGPEATYKPMNVPQYIQSRYTKENLPTIIAKFLVGGQVPTGSANTLLSEMIDYGKISYVVSRMLPCKADSVIAGYSEKEMTGLRENIELIWRHFIEKELLYETSEFVKQKYLGERPSIYEISNSCPGRVGAWLGWQIVEEYMSQQPRTITELLAERDHHRIFSESGFKPVND